ncbi:MAG: hypothetical protein HC849_06590 [Oscillatoriales cyanobacterium RU_3_3]|nr:hypothetical protein [Oscillatoriales cyanobacterium RU_3_3]
MSFPSSTRFLNQKNIFILSDKVSYFSCDRAEFMEAATKIIKAIHVSRSLALHYNRYIEPNTI